MWDKHDWIRVIRALRDKKAFSHPSKSPRGYQSLDPKTQLPLDSPIMKDPSKLKAQLRLCIQALMSTW